jgi:tRNA threonylcarbamoyladenosine biosynthesis protein TsaE
LYKAWRSIIFWLQVDGRQATDPNMLAQQHISGVDWFPQAGVSAARQTVVMDAFTVISKGPEDTAAIAAAIAAQLRRGDVLLLGGELAAGKTCFVKALARALGSADAVTSPTYAIAQFYDTGAGSLVHVDAYRLTGIEEYRDLGLEDFYDEAIMVIEWGRLVAGEFSNFLSIDFDFVGAGENLRKLTISSVGDRWRPVIGALSQQIRGAQS